MEEGYTQDLVERARAGDAQAYEQIFERVAPRLLTYIRVRLGKKLRGKLDPVDVLQEAYVEAHRSFARFEAGGDQRAFSRWIHGIVENRIRDLAEHFQAQKRTPPSPLVQGSSVLQRIRAERTGPATASARRDEQQQLLEALERLEEDERQVLLLRYFHGMTLVSIGEQVGVSKATVRRILGRARIHLGAALEQLDPDPD